MMEKTTDPVEEKIELLSQRLEDAESALSAIRDGEIDALLIKAQKEQVFTLESPEHTYQLLAEALPNAAATLTDDGRVIHANGAFVALTGQPLSSLRERRIHEAVSEASHSRLERMLGNALLTDAMGELVFERGDGTQVSREFKVRCWNEGVLGRCLVLTDVTMERRYEDLRRTQEELRQAMKRLSQADRRKDEFLAMLSHELRNPLAPIRNALEILKHCGLPGGEPEWCRDVIDRQVATMSRILEDLFDVSRISRGKLQLRKERVFLNDVIEAALETSRPNVDTAHQELTVSLPQDPIPLRADPVRLAQVFSNLLNNAVRYTEQGGRITLEATVSGSHLNVSLKDNGIGISPEMMPHIFDIFTQAPPTGQRPQMGLGIGLSLVKGVVELHHGSVQVQSDGVGRGSEFIVRLPIAPHHDDAAVDEKLPTKSPGTYRILIVDDNRDSADSLAVLLELMGNDVVAVYDAEKVFSTAQDMRPDATVLDISAPRINGDMTCRRIRQEQWGRNMLLIALTGWDQEDRRRAEENGFDGHLVKPVDAAVLLRTIAELSEQKAG